MHPQLPEPGAGSGIAGQGGRAPGCSADTCPVAGSLPKNTGLGWLSGSRGKQGTCKQAGQAVHPSSQPQPISAAAQGVGQTAWTIVWLGS